jgi:hypothetical protein
LPPSWTARLDDALCTAILAAFLDDALHAAGLAIFLDGASTTGKRQHMCLH